MNKLFQSLTQNNPISQLNAIKSNPAEFLKRYGVNLPTNITSPEGIINHLLNSGQITQQQLNRAMQMRNNPMFKGMFK